MLEKYFFHFLYLNRCDVDDDVTVHKQINIYYFSVLRFQVSLNPPWGLNVKIKNNDLWPCFFNNKVVLPFDVS